MELEEKNPNQIPTNFRGLILGEPELKDPQVFLEILRRNSSGLSMPDDYSGSFSLLRQKKELFETSHLEEITEYCAELIPKLIRAKGSAIQIRELAALAAQAVLIQQERSESQSE